MVIKSGHENDLMVELLRLRIWYTTFKTGVTSNGVNVVELVAYSTILPSCHFTPIQKVKRLAFVQMIQSFQTSTLSNYLRNYSAVMYEYFLLLE